jgi:hypothetical protein
MADRNLPPFDPEYIARLANIIAPRQMRRGDEYVLGLQEIILSPSQYDQMVVEDDHGEKRRLVPLADGGWFLVASVRGGIRGGYVVQGWRVNRAPGATPPVPGEAIENAGPPKSRRVRARAGRGKRKPAPKADQILAVINHLTDSRTWGWNRAQLVRMLKGSKITKEYVYKCIRENPDVSRAWQCYERESRGKGPTPIGEL